MQKKEPTPPPPPSSSSESESSDSDSDSDSSSSSEEETAAAPVVEQAKILATTVANNVKSGAAAVAKAVRHPLLAIPHVVSQIC
jgi:hypothetical protein